MNRLVCAPVTFSLRKINFPIEIRLEIAFVSLLRYVITILAGLGPVYMEVEDPGRWGNPLTWGNPPVHIISHFNLITFT